MKNYDVIVIGSGGGSKITRPAANLGHKVAIIEKGRLGGTCLNHGCIPSKMLIHPAEVLTQLVESHRFDILIKETPEINFKGLVSRVNQTIDAESDSIAPVYNKHPNITYYSEHARFIAPKILRVGNDTLTADKIFCAVGARPFIPEIEGLENTPFWTYHHALRETVQPKSLIIVGGGYIAMELGFYFQALGTAVTFIVRTKPLRYCDSDIQKEFEDYSLKTCDLRLGAIPKKVMYKNSQFRLEFEQEGRSESCSAEQLLIATGVHPNTHDLGLEKTNIKCTQDGFITVDETLQTTQSGVWAFGDVIGRHLFRHSANFEGEYLFEHVFGGQKKAKISYPPIPFAVFCHPQIAGVGMTEDELIKRGVPYIVGKNRYSDSAMGMALRSEIGFVKVLYDPTSRKLIGAHIIGVEAATMIHMLIAFMVMNATIDDMMNMVYIHPALPEVVRNAVRKASSQFKESP